MSSPIPLIIIIQTSKETVDDCRKRLDEAGLEGVTDYLIFEDPDGAEPFIEKGKFQFLITGSFGGDCERADAFVEAMKQKNPSLIAGWCSNKRTLVRTFEPYEALIKKGDNWESLIRYMKGFLKNPRK